MKIHNQINKQFVNHQFCFDIPSTKKKLF